MKIDKSVVIAALSQFNPWWSGQTIPDLPSWRREIFNEVFKWTCNPPTHRALMLSGARQVGKTTLLLQTIQELLKKGVPPANIVYITFDHPLLKIAGIETVLEAWREREIEAPGPEYLFLDEVQLVADWGVWIKHQVDFLKKRRIIFTGSATPLIEAKQESGVGRWHTIPITTLSFYEYLQIKKIRLPSIPEVKNLEELFTWQQADRLKVADVFKDYGGHFHDYLVRGGYPQTAQVESISEAQRLLREDIIDKILRRDMTALFGVRRIIELEHAFLYLCMHEGGLLDITDLANNLDVKRPTAQHFLNLLEATHLIYKLAPYGYGKEVLRARYKVYLADPAISSALLLKGKAILEDPTALGMSIETAVFKHLYVHFSAHEGRMSYWRGPRNKEVDLIVEREGQILTPFEVKYRNQIGSEREFEGLIELCRQKSIEHGYIVTKNWNAWGELKIKGTKIMQIPASLLCYLLK